MYFKAVNYHHIAVLPLRLVRPIFCLIGLSAVIKSLTSKENRIKCYNNIVLYLVHYDTVVSGKGL